MAKPTEIPIELDTEDVEAGFGRIVGKLQDARKASEEFQKTYGRAFAANVIGESLGRVSQHFDGLTGSVSRSGEAIVKGFMQGGKVGAIFSSITNSITTLSDEFTAFQKTAAEATAAAVAGHERQALALVELTARVREAEASLHALALTEIGGDVAVTKQTLSLRQLGEQYRATGEAIQNIDRAVALNRKEHTSLGKTSFGDLAERREALDAALGGLTGSKSGFAAQRDALSKQIDELTALKIERETLAEREVSKKRLEERKRYTGQRRTDDDKEYKETLERAKAAAVAHERAIAKHEDEAAERARAVEQRAVQAETRFRRAAAETQAQHTIDAMAEVSRRRREQDEIDAEVTSAAIDREIAYRETMTQNALDGVSLLAEVAGAFATSEKQRTVILHAERAAQAGIEAAVETAKAFAAYPDVAGVISHSIAAAKFAAVAGSNVASAVGASGAPPTRGARPEASAETARATPGGFGSRSTSREGRGEGFTVVLPSGGVLVTKADVARAIGEGLAEYDRRR